MKQPRSSKLRSCAIWFIRALSCWFSTNDSTCAGSHTQPSAMISLNWVYYILLAAMKSGEASPHSKTWPPYTAPLRVCVLECGGIPPLWVDCENADRRILAASDPSVDHRSVGPATDILAFTKSTVAARAETLLPKFHEIISTVSPE